MARFSNLAYDFEKFETAKKENKQVPKIKKIEQTNPKQKINLAKLVSMLLVVIMITGSMIYSDVKLNEITMDITKAKKELSLVENDNIRLQMQLNSKLTLANIEQIAVSELGLVKLDKSQFEYIKLSEDNKIETNIPKKSNIFEKIQQFIFDIKEYILG